jgi:membrane-associated phospholipid phosphatase
MQCSGMSPAKEVTMHAAVEALAFPAALVSLALLVLLGGSPVVVAGGALLAAAALAGLDRLHRGRGDGDHAPPRARVRRGAAVSH